MVNLAENQDKGDNSQVRMNPGKWDPIKKGQPRTLLKSSSKLLLLVLARFGADHHDRDQHLDINNRAQL